MGLIVDKNDKVLKAGDVVDIHQTVNGQSRFYIASIDPLDVRYDFDRNYIYEYNMEELFAPCRYSGDVDFEII